MKKKAGLLVAALAALVATGVSVVLTVAHARAVASPWYNAFCGGDRSLLGLPIDCTKVSASAHAQIFGIPTSVLGGAFYLALLMLALIALWGRKPSADKARALLFGGGLGSVVLAVYLLGVQVFAIRALCAFCLMLYGAHLAIFTGSLLALEESVPAALRRVGTLLGHATREPLVVCATAAFVVLTGAGELGYLQLKSSPGTDPAANVLELLDEAARVDLAPEALSPSDGPPEAPYVIVEFSDFMCPYCRQAASDMRQLRAEQPDSTRLIFKHYPLDSSCNPYVPRQVHVGACDGARAAVCAQRLGAFWEYHDGLFARQDEIFKGDVRGHLVQLAVDLGLPQSAFSACLESADTDKIVRSDVDEAHRLGVPGTPAFILNGRAFYREPLDLGSLAVGAFRKIIAAGRLAERAKN